MSSKPRSRGTNRRSVGWLWILVLPAVVPLLALAVAAQEPPPGLVAYWTLDEGSGDVAADSVGSYDGTVLGATWVSGVVGNALRFDGIDDLVSTSFNPDAVIGDGNSYTETFWLNQGPDTGKQGVVVASGDGSRRFYFINEGSYQYRVGLGNQYTPTFQFPNSPVDSWTHVAVIFDSSASRLTVHANGNPTPVLDYAYTGNRDLPDMDLILSEVHPTYFYPFTGMLDEVAIYDRVLTSEEIEAQYYNGLAGKGLTEGGMDNIYVSDGVTLLYKGDVDEVMAAVELDGQVTIATNVNNSSEWQDPILEEPTLSMTVAEGYLVDWVEPEEQLVPGSEYVWEFPDIAQWGWQPAEIGLVPGAEPVSFTPGFHLTREVSEAVIDAPSAQQIVTVTLTQEEATFEGKELSNVTLQIWGAYGTPDVNTQVVSFQASPEFDCHAGGVYVYCIDQFTEVPRTYQVDVTFDVQLQGAWDQIEYAPRVFAYADFGFGFQAPLVATSVTGTNDYGTWTWATGEPRLWRLLETGLEKEVEFESRISVLNHVPTALCGHVFRLAGPDCALEASIDVGSYDPDGDDISLSQHPPGPYLYPWERVRLDVEDEHGAMSSCEAYVVPLSPDDDGDGHEVCGGDCDDGDPTVFPGAEEICDGKDNDCDGVVDNGFPDGDGDAVADCLDNCPTTLNPGQEDCDGDGSGDLCDLDDADADGLTDAQEINFAGGICPSGCPDPADGDSDGDGLLDGFESDPDPDRNCDFCAADTDGDGILDASDPFCNDPTLTGDCAQDLADFEAYILSLPTSVFQAPGADTERQRRQTRAHLASIVGKAAKHLDKCDTAFAVTELEKAWTRVDGAEPPLDDMVGGSAEKALVLDTIEDFLYLFEVGACGCEAD